jgi:hypothetical protein
VETRTTITHLIPAALIAAAANKPVEIQLAWYVETYKVLAIMNTTILKPGESLSVEAVDQLNATPGWTVKIADNTVIQTLFGLGASAAVMGAKVL